MSAPEDEVRILANHMKSTGIDLETWRSIDRTQEVSSFAQCVDRS
jgi:hypothetical protein